MFWAPSSQYMNHCDFCLWGLMKDLVYMPMPATMADLKQKIIEVFHSIPEETVRKAVMDMKPRVQKLVMKEGLGFKGKIIKI